VFHERVTLTVLVKPVRVFKFLKRAKGYRSTTEMCRYFLHHHHSCPVMKLSATGFSSHLNQSISYILNLFPKIHFNIIFPTIPLLSQCSSWHVIFPNPCYMSRPPVANNLWWRKQIMGISKLKGSYYNWPIRWADSFKYCNNQLSSHSTSLEEDPQLLGLCG
jgi:hypothetical protein